MEKEEEKEEGEEVSFLSFFPVSRGWALSRERSIQLLADAISVGGKSNTPSREKWKEEE